MLGNDVIDLEDIDARPETFRPRFDERVFSAEERRAIARDAAPLACRWAHWGAKEAAYKLARRLDPNCVFSPIQLTPRFEPAEMASRATTPSSGPSASYSAEASWVERYGRMGSPYSGAPDLEIRSFETAQSVHVIALPVGSDWDALVFSVEERFLSASAPAPAPAPDPSGAVRRLAVREIGRSLGVEAERLSIGRCGKLPTVELDGARTSLSLSLSHHGRFVAFAMTPTLDVRSKDVRSKTVMRSEMILTDRVMDSVSPKVASE